MPVSTNTKPNYGTMKEDQKINILKDEYIKIHELIDNFDGKMLKIKEWSITVSVAAIGGAYVAKTPILLTLASFSAFIFWVLEYKWKTYQFPYFDRALEIENFFKNEDIEINALQISNTWEKEHYNLSFKKKLEIFRVKSIFIPHIFTIFLGIILYYLHVFGIVPIAQ